MTKSDAFLDPAIVHYIVDATGREPAVLQELREETSRMTGAEMQITSEQGQLMQLFARLIDAKRYLEIGVFTGYSALAMALALPDDGRVLALDVNPEYTAVARRYWERAGVASKIDLKLAPALETLDALLAAGAAGSFDIAFIDADKTNVDEYYERCLRLVRKNGLILVDNVLWSARVLDGQAKDPDTRALRAISYKAGKDDRVDVTLLPVSDGILVARIR